MANYPNFREEAEIARIRHELEMAMRLGGTYFDPGSQSIRPLSSEYDGVNMTRAMAAALVTERKPKPTDELLLLTIDDGDSDAA